MLRVAPTLTLPPEAVTETFGLVAGRGAGKSNAAAVFAEELFTAKLPFVVIDPVRAWWGLRSSADGKGPGLAIPIFGGRHGDVPLERGGGQLVADLVVDQRLSCVLDLSDFESEGAKKQFLLEFARRLYQRNEHPLHLFLEEADDYIPQKPMGRDEPFLLRAWENIVRRGRARGLGCTLITQRSAVLNKNVLTQVQTLIPMRTTGPQDIAAIREWVKYHQQADTLLESLPSLADGEAWIWSPHFLKKMVRVHFRRRATFDSGATPRASASPRPPATLADVNLDALKTKMAATIERAKQEDPRELRRRIADLERERRRPPQGLTALRSVQRIEVPVLRDRQLARTEALVGRVEKIQERLTEVLGDTIKAMAETRDMIRGVVGNVAARAAPGLRTEEGPPHAATYARPARRAEGRSAERDGVQQRILDTIAMLGVRGIAVTRDTVARWMGIHPNGGRYLTSLAQLRAHDLLDGWHLTERGHAAAKAQETGEHAAFAALIDDGKRTVLRALVEAHMPLSREELAAKLGIHPNGGRFLTNLAWLRTMGLIPERGRIQATDALRR